LVFEQLGLDGSYIPRTYIEQIQLEKLMNDVMVCILFIIYLPSILLFLHSITLFYLYCLICCWCLTPGITRRSEDKAQY
jgi:hypothetical protein